MADDMNTRIRGEIASVRSAHGDAKKKIPVAGYSSGEIKKMVDSAFACTSYERPRHLTATAFLEGDQWVMPDPTGSMLIDMKVDRYEGDNFPKITRNFVGPSTRRLLGRVGVPLQFEVTPMAPDDASKQAAKLSESVCRSVQLNHRVEDIDMTMTHEGMSGGSAAVYVMWDASASTQLGVDPVTGKSFGLGDVNIGVADIGEFAVEPGARDGATARWWVLKRALPPTEAQEMFDLPEKPSAGATATPSRAGQRGGGKASLVDVITLFERPHGKKKGGVWSMVGGEIVEATEWPFPWKDELNLEIFRPERRSRSAYGRTPVWDVIPIQVEINRAVSNMHAHLRDVGSAKLMTDGAFAEDIEAGISTLRVNADSVGGFRPGYLEPPQIPSWVQGHAGEAGAALNDILGVSEVMQGKAPGSIQTGAALGLLVDQSDQSLHPLVRERSRVWGRIMTMVLKLYEVKVKAPEMREVRDTIKGQFSFTTQWSGDMLSGHTTAVVPEEKMMPPNRASGAAKAQMFLQSGLIKTAREYSSIEGVPPTQDVGEAIDPHWTKASRENYFMATGRPEVVEKFDDHAIHMQCHIVEMTSSKWDTFTEEVKNNFREHMQGHETSAAEAAGNLRAQDAVDPMLAAAPQVTNVDPRVQAMTGGSVATPMDVPQGSAEAGPVA